MLIWQGVSFATVNIAEEIKAPLKKTITKDSIKRKIVPQKPSVAKQVQIEGYADSVYVRFIVDITKDKMVSGQMIEEAGATYVYGEIIDGMLHLYDTHGKHYQVIVP